MGSSGKSSFSIVVVGGGIAGLATATALAQKGHDVTVLESKPSLNEFGASIGITSNGVRVLKAWGLQKEFEKVVTTNGFLDLRDGKTNTMLGHLPHNKNNASLFNYGAEYWNINRQDYQETLAHAAEAKGAKIMYNAEPESIDVDGCAVTLKDGRTLTADAIIGADGVASAVRRSIPALRHIEPIPLETGCFRCTVPKEKMRGNPKIEWLLDSGDEYAFMTPTLYILSWPLPERRPYDIVVAPISYADVPAGRWGVRGNPEDVRKATTHFCPEIVELMKHIDTCVQWKIAELPELETCRSENGRVVLIGDAWHAMLPHSASGGNSAIEDAACFAECVDWASKNKRDITAATKAFEDIRTPRVRRMQAASREGVGFLEASGDSLVLRNQALAAATQLYDEDLKLPDEVRRSRPKATPDMDAVFPSEPYMQWRGGYDAIAVTKEYLAGL